MTDVMNIKKIEVENFKNIPDLKYDLQGRSVFIVGDNGVGKTSLIQGIWCVLTGKEVPPVPVTEGKKEGHVKVEFGEGYIAEMKFKQGKSGGTLKLTHNDEAQTQPRTTLSELIGDISFDVFEFLKMTEAKQIKYIMEFAGIDLSKLNKQREEIFNTRRDTNRDIRNLEGKMSENGLSEEDMKTFAEEKDTEDLMKQISQVEDINKHAAKGQRLLGMMKDRLDKIDDRRSSLEKEIEELKAVLERKETELGSLNDEISPIMVERHNKLVTWCDAHPHKSVTDLSNQLTTRQRFNQKVKLVAQANEDITKKIDLEELSKQYTDKLEEIDKEKKRVISEHQLKIPGLKFDEERLLVDGLPFSEDQIRKSRIIQVGMDIMMSLNPRLKICRVKDGSLLGFTMDEVLEMAEEQDFQLFIEVVDRDEKKLSLEIIEQG